MRGGRGVMQDTSEAKMRPFMSVMKNKLFSDQLFPNNRDFATWV